MCREMVPGIPASRSNKVRASKGIHRKYSRRDWVFCFTPLNDSRLPLSGAANGVQAVAFLWPLESDALDILALNAYQERADNLFLNHAEKTRVLVALVVAVNCRLIDQCSQSGSISFGRST